MNKEVYIRITDDQLCKIIDTNSNVMEDFITELNDGSYLVQSGSGFNLITNKHGADKINESMIRELTKYCNRDDTAE